MQVVDRIEARAEDFVGSLQMMQVGSAEIAAGVAVATLIERARIGAVAGVSYLDVAVTRVQPAVARIARRQHAVEHVDAVADRLDDVFRRADAHQVARLVVRQPRRDMGFDAAHCLLRLADRQTADRIADEAGCGQCRQRFRYSVG